MTDYAPCRGCGEVQCPINEICFDCAYPDKEQRQLRVERFRAALEAAEETLRDKFAMAAMQGLLASDTQQDIDERRIAVLAYSQAREMLLARDEAEL